MGKGWGMDGPNTEGMRRKGSQELGKVFFSFPPFLFLALFFSCLKTKRDLSSGPELPRPEGQGRPPRGWELRSYLWSRPPPPALGALSKHNCWPSCLVAEVSLLLFLRGCEFGGMSLTAVFFREAETWCALLTNPLPGTGRPPLSKEQDETLTHRGPRAFARS